MWDFKDSAYIHGKKVFKKDMTFQEYQYLCGYYENGKRTTDVEKIDDIVNGCYIVCFHSNITCFIAAPCGCCSHCLDKKRTEYESRALFEAATNPFLYFFTLTYDNSHLSSCGLRKADVSQFFKLFRETFAYKYSKRFNVPIEDARRVLSFRAVYVGEYGVDPRYTRRPHYHGILFFKERIPDRHLKWFISIWRSCWKYGRRYDFQECKNPIASARYICKYITKQQMSRDVVPEGKNPCFIQGPMKCGLGASDIERFREDIINSTSNTIWLNIGGKLVRTVIPDFIKAKIFPTFSRVYKLANPLVDYFFELDLMRQELLKRMEIDPFAFDVTRLDEYYHSFDWLRCGFQNRQPYSIEYHRHMCHGYDPVSVFASMDSFELEACYRYQLKLLLSQLPDPQEFFELLKPKLDWQNNLQLPDLQLHERLEQKDNKVIKNVNYVRDRCMNDNFDLLLHADK